MNHRGIIARIITISSQKGVALIASLTAPDQSALRTLTDSARSKFMHEIGEIALARGMKLQTLADRLETQPANVARHFETETPRQSTIEKYAKLLDMSPVYVRLIQGGELTDEEYGGARQLFYYQLDYAVHELGADTVASIKKHYQERDLNVRRALLRSFQLADLRRGAYYPDKWLQEWGTISPMLRTFVKEVMGKDLRELRPVSDPKERFLLDLWVLLTDRNLFQPREAKLLLDVATTMLRLKRIKPDLIDRMRNYLEEDTLHYRSLLDEPKPCKFSQTKKRK